MWLKKLDVFDGSPVSQAASAGSIKWSNIRSGRVVDDRRLVDYLLREHDALAPNVDFNIASLGLSLLGSQVKV
jgi:hypothetical protein